MTDWARELALLHHESAPQPPVKKMHRRPPHQRDSPTDRGPTIIHIMLVESLHSLLMATSASGRCGVPLLSAGTGSPRVAPSPELEPMAVVESQLKALRLDDVATCFNFCSPLHRRTTAPLPNFEKMVRTIPAYSCLLDNSHFELLSALSVSYTHLTLPTICSV